MQQTLLSGPNTLHGEDQFCCSFALWLRTTSSYLIKYSIDAILYFPAIRRNREVQLLPIVQLRVEFHLKFLLSFSI